MLNLTLVVVVGGGRHAVQHAESDLAAVIVEHSESDDPAVAGVGSGRCRVQHA